LLGGKQNRFSGTNYEKKVLREKVAKLNKTTPRSYHIKNGQMVRREGHPPPTWLRTLLPVNLTIIILVI